MVASPSIKKAGSQAKGKKSGGNDDFAGSRARLDKRRLKRERATHWAHFWNICPKCGGDMFEQKANGIYFDVCRSCRGIYIDKAELDLAKRFIEAGKFTGSLLRRAKKPTLPK